VSDRSQFGRLLQSPRRVHVIGAGGAGMSGLAKLLSGLGHTVTGSDLKPGLVLDALGDLGITTWVGHDPEAMLDAELVVASSAVPDKDPELRAAAAAGIPTGRRPDLLDALTLQMPAIGIAGTHGKTTSTALMVTALRAAGRDPSFLVGGQLLDLNTGAHLGERDLFVLEADEAFGTFRRLHLVGLIVTNIEADHLDYYGNVAALEEAFALVANRTNGPVVACGDDPGVRRLAGRADVITYGRSDDADWRLTDITHAPSSVRFRLSGSGFDEQIEVPRPGLHVALDAAAVVALLAELGLDATASLSGIAGFAGVRRRFEVRSRVGGVTVVDDYAHHPTEIAATIAAGASGGWNRVWAIFQPHRYTRTADLAPEFGGPLAVADEVVVTDVYSAGEAPLPGVSGKLVAEAVEAAGGNVAYVPDLREVVDHIEPRLETGDLVLLLGAGDVNTLAHPLAEALERR
jgi:UDP-N-acetylmuramate--alanine ligase